VLWVTAATQLQHCTATAAQLSCNSNSTHVSRSVAQELQESREAVGSQWCRSCNHRFTQCFQWFHTRWSVYSTTAGFLYDVILRNTLTDFPVSIRCRSGNVRFLHTIVSSNWWKCPQHLSRSLARSLAINVFLLLLVLPYSLSVHRVIDPGRFRGLDSWKYVGGVRVCFDPLKCRPILLFKTVAG